MSIKTKNKEDDVVGAGSSFYDLTYGNDLRSGKYDQGDIGPEAQEEYKSPAEQLASEMTNNLGDSKKSGNYGDAFNPASSNYVNGGSKSNAFKSPSFTPSYTPEKKTATILSSPSTTSSSNLTDVEKAFENYNRVSGTGLEKYASSLYSQYANEYSKVASQNARQTRDSVNASAGGYGSSYSAIAGENAFNDTMSGLADQKADIYNMAMNMKESDVNNAVNDYNMAVEKENYSGGSSKYSVGDLVNEIASNETLSNMSEDRLKDYLTTVAGADASEIEQALNYIRNDANKVVTEQQDLIESNSNYAPSTASDIISYASEINANSSVNEESKNRIRSYSYSRLNEAINDLDNQASFFGLDEETWSSMKDEQKLDYALDVAGKMAKDGIISKEDYMSMVENDALEVLDYYTRHRGFGGVFDELNVGNVTNIVSKLQENVENGYLDQSSVDSIAEKIAGIAIRNGLEIEKRVHGMTGDEMYGSTSENELTKEQKDIYEKMFSKYITKGN